MASNPAQQKKEEERQTLYLDLHRLCNNNNHERASKVASKSWWNFGLIIDKVIFL